MNNLFVNEPFKTRWNAVANEIQNSDTMAVIREGMSDLAQEHGLEVSEVSVITRRILDFEAKATGKANAQAKPAKKGKAQPVQAVSTDIESMVAKLVQKALTDALNQPVENSADKARQKARARHEANVEQL
jgi:hypothetical protein